MAFPSTRVAPPLLQVWPHQEPSIDIQSECQLDMITIPLGVWFFEEANESNVKNGWRICLDPVKNWFWRFSTLDPWKNIPFYEGFKRWERSNYPNVCKNCHVIQLIVHNKQNHVQKYPGSPIASAKRKTQTLFEMGHLDDGFHRGWFFLWCQIQSQAFQNFKSNLIPKTNCTITSNSEWVCEHLYASWIPSSRFDWCICDRRS